MSEATAQQTPPTPRKTFLHTIEVEISTEESAVRTKRLLDVLNEIDKIEADKQSRVSDFNAELKQKRKEAHKVRDAINLGKERRDVECYEVPEEKQNTIHIVRASDGKKVDERAMTLEDRMNLGKSKEDAKKAQAATESPASEGQGGGAANDTSKAGVGKVTRIKASDAKKKRAQRDAKEAADKARAAADANEAKNDEDEGA